MPNRNLRRAKLTKNDEFYTQYSDIQEEIEAYLEYDSNIFQNKVVYCNCDDPFESNFFSYFVLNFNKLRLKQLITTSYKPSPIANTQLELFGDDKTLTKSKKRPKITANKFNISSFIINEVHASIGANGDFNLKNIARQLRFNKNNEWTPLEEDGDFRSAESIDLLKQSDIVVTNPPFSLFREYIKQLFDYDKKFLIISNKNAVTYKEIFPLFQENKLWSGRTKWSGGMWFETPSKKMKNVPAIWVTNLDHGRRHQLLSLMTEADIIKFATKKPFEKYENYDAIEVKPVKHIPSDYKGVMGVPISFLDKYNPNQFELLGIMNTGEENKGIRYEGTPHGRPVLNGVEKYLRILIRHK